MGHLVGGSCGVVVWAKNEEMKGEAGEDGMKKRGVKGHHVAHPPLVQSGWGAVPDDEYTFRGSHPRACASQDRMHDTTRASVSWEVRVRKAWMRAAMEEDLERAGQRVSQGSERGDVN